jgi:hypothetical protein
VRFSFALIGSVALAVAIVGCGSGTPAGSATPGATLAPGATATPAGVATATPAGATNPPVASGSPIAGTGHECDAVPTFSLSNPDQPTPAPDADLLAHFPATIDGQPLTDVTAVRWLYLMCAFGGQATVDQMMAEASGGFNFATMSFGEATATVDGSEVKLNAFRTPGNDANTLIQSLTLLAAQSGTTINPGDVTASNVAGKSVFVWTDTDGNKSYAYPSGDTLIMFDSVTDSQATKILTALP